MSLGIDGHSANTLRPSNSIRRATPLRLSIMAVDSLPPGRVDCPHYGRKQSLPESRRACAGHAGHVAPAVAAGGAAAWLWIGAGTADTLRRGAAGRDWVAL